MIPECYEIDEIESFCALLSQKKEIYIFGAGVYGRIFGQFFNEKEIAWRGYIDNNSKIWGKNILGHNVFKLTELEMEREKIAIVISNMFMADDRECIAIYEQLIQWGIEDKQILQIYKNPCIFSEVTYCVRKPQKALEKLKKFKNLYKNKRAFLLGNGPSLQLCDLEKLKNELVFGCNGIYKLYKNIDAQLTAFFFNDVQFFERFVSGIDEIKKFNSISKYLFTTIVNEYTKEYFENDFKLYFLYDKYKKDTRYYISEDIREGVCRWGTSVMALLQIMLFMGIDEIYLLGMDFSFHRELNDKGDIVINQNIKTHPDEIDDGELGTYGLYNKKLIEDGWLFAKEYTDSHGIKIYNATRGGKLEVFERVNFDDLF